MENKKAMGDCERRHLQNLEPQSNARVDAANQPIAKQAYPAAVKALDGEHVAAILEPKLNCTNVGLFGKRSTISSRPISWSYENTVNDLLVH